MSSRTVVVTGAGSGIGRAIAHAFCENGDEVFASDISLARLEEMAQATGAPANLHTCPVDVSDYTSVSELVDTAVAATGKLDVIVNCAGVFDGYADVEETTPELWAKVIGVNLSGAYNGCRAAALKMIPQKSGRIITVGSVAGQRGAADGLSYVASKAGIEGLNRRLAVDVGRHNITANVIAPGVIRTNLRATSTEILGEMVATQQRGIGVSPEMWNFLIPAHRSGDPAEVANVAVFIASEQASYINGQVIAVDGGWTAT